MAISSIGNPRLTSAGLPDERRTHFDVTLLDGFRLRGGQFSQVPVSAARLVALLALRGPLDRSLAAGTLRPECTEAHAVGSLRSALWRINALAAGLVIASRRSVSLADGVTVDVRALDGYAVSLREGSPPTDAQAVLELAAGDLLPGWDEDWVVFERERVRQVHVGALTALARAFATAGDPDRGILVAYRALALDPLRESTHRLLIEIHISAGDYAEALRRFSRSRDLLSRELGLSPSPRMIDLVRGIPGRVRVTTR